MTDPRATKNIPREADDWLKSIGIPDRHHRKSVFYHFGETIVPERILTTSLDRGPVVAECHEWLMTHAAEARWKFIFGAGILALNRRFLIIQFPKDAEDQMVHFRLRWC